MTHRILIIDDEKNIRTTLARGLDLEGFAVDGAEDGTSGLALLQSFAPDLVLLDLKLPDRDGLELLGELRQLAPSTAVIVMTGKGTVENAVRALKLGAIDFILKPVDFDLHLVVQGLADMFRIRCEDKGLRLEVLGLGNPPLLVRGDEAKLRQILINLLANAVKFTQRGGVTLKVSWSRSAPSPPHPPRPAP